jgi:hypothetical protein
MSLDAIEPPDSHLLNAAVGWAELGLPDEALVELSRLRPELLGHPDVLDLRWKVHALRRDWESALVVAHAQLHVSPDRASAWINQSFTLHELKRTGEAYDALVGVVDKFPEAGVMPYNLACYTCQLGRLDDARIWLKRAREVLGKEELKNMAEHDPDLEPLRAEL